MKDQHQHNHTHTAKENEASNEVSQTYSFKTFLPLITLFALIVTITLGIEVWYGEFAMFRAMSSFMGSFFLIFGFFKIINLKGFANAYQMYDLIGQKSRAYAVAYPFIEIGLGIAYFLAFQLLIVNWITLVLMLVSAAGVYNELRKGKKIVCACLGAVFKIPMTYVTLTEDLLMAVMAGIMIYFM